MNTQAPTARQLAYLRNLAMRTGTTFANPGNRQEAGREIERLRGLPCTSDEEAHGEEDHESAHTEGGAAGYGGHDPGRSGARAQVERSCRLGGYRDENGRTREILAIALPHGTLVIDRLAEGGHDPRLLARLEPDEAAGNSKLIASMYLQDTARGRCRAVTGTDLLGPQPERTSDRTGSQWRAPLVAGIGTLLQIRCVRHDGRRSLRWTTTTRTARRPQVLPLRGVFAALQDYEPAAAMTCAAIARHARNPAVSVTALRGELLRAVNSPIVLNRALRERVERAIGRDGVSMSEIAMRCGRIKRDARGRESGETSWLARRIGLIPEGGACAPTPWVHSDVLALIARDGLGVSPVEVEVPLEQG